MKPIKFKGHNSEVAKDQDEYITLPAYISCNPTGDVTTCWKLAWWERLVILFTGRLWWNQLTFRTQLQPVQPSMFKPKWIPKTTEEDVKD